jgi:hypothetical protein
MPILYSIPLPLLAMVILLPCLAISLGGTYFVRTRGWMADKDDSGAIALTHAFAGMLYAVALGLMVVNVQSGYSEVKLTVMQESNSIEDLYMDSMGLSGPEGAEIQAVTQSYLEAVIDEWPSIGDEQDSDLLSHEFAEELATIILAYEPVTDKDLIVYTEILQDFNGMLDLRRERLHLGRDGVGPVTWFVIAFGALITIGMAWFYPIQRTQTHYSLVVVMTAMFAIMIFLILAMDHPILGSFSVDSAPFEEARVDLEAWQN